MPSRLDVTIVCPLRFEQRFLRKAGATAVDQVHCCGPGATAIRNWVIKAGPVGGPVVLAGLAGGLRPDRPAGSAWLVTEVREVETADTWTPPLGEPPAPTTSGPGTCVIVSTPTTVIEPRDKRALAERGADLVDLESAAFARAASEAGWRWGIIRGVSDAWTTRLPKGVDGWVDAEGSIRSARVLVDLLRRPGALRDLIRLRADATGALRSVARLLRSDRDAGRHPGARA